MMEETDFTNNALGNIFEGILAKHPRGLLIGKVMLCWQNVASVVLGSTAAAQSHPLRLSGDCLVIACNSSVIVSELYLQQAALLAAYKRHFQGARLPFTKLQFIYQHEIQAAEQPAALVSAAPKTTSDADKTASPAAAAAVAARTAVLPLKAAAEASSAEASSAASSLTSSTRGRQHFAKQRYRVPYVTDAELKRVYPDTGLVSAFMPTDELR